MNATKITNASVRVSLSYNYNTFEVTLGLENQDGISPLEIEDFRLQAQNMASESVEDFKATQPAERQIKSVGKKDNITVSDIENLPLYSEIKKRKEELKGQKNAKN